MRRIHALCLALLLFLSLWLPVSYAAEEADTADSVTTSEPPAESELAGDALGRDTPRGSLEGFLHAADDDDYVKAVEYIDLRNLPRRYKNAQPTQLASMLASVIEREIRVNLEEISNFPEGVSGDGLPVYREELGLIEDGDKEYQLLLQRVPDGKGGRIWKISNATVADIADLYQKFGYGPISEALAGSLPDVSFFGMELFKWFLMLGVFLLAYPLVMLFAMGLARLFSNPASPLYTRLKRYLVGPCTLFTVFMILTWYVSELGVGISGQKLFEANTLNAIIFTWVLLSGVGLVRDFYAIRLRSQGREGAVTLLRPIAQSFQMLIIILVFLAWLDNVGFNITTLLAGLGVGGIAMALALQKPLEDVFGALTLYTQQPVRVGDFCRFGSDMGTIEEIGLRTTRIRTLADTLISIPNSRLATELIDNYSAREKILYKSTLRLRVDTTREQMEEIIAELRRMLESHERVIQEGPRVRFQAIGEDALEVTINAYTATKTFPDFLEVAEDINMQILDIISAAGTTLAVPAKSIYMENGTANT
jgi:MscS family membrane protein